MDKMNIYFAVRRCYSFESEIFCSDYLKQKKYHVVKTNLLEWR